MGSSLRVSLSPRPSRYPKSCIHPQCCSALLPLLPAQQRQLSDCLGTSPWETDKSQTTSLLLCSQWSPAIPPTILLSIKRLLCHPPATHDCHWQPKRDARRDVPHTSRLCTRGGAVKWPRSSVASQCDFSQPSRGCSMCSDPNANRTT